MKEHIYTYKEAIHTAVNREYTHKAPATLRHTIRTLMQLPLVKSWQFVSGVFLLLASPLSLYFFEAKLIYSPNVLLLMNVAAGSIAFLLIFAGVAHRYSSPKNKAELLHKIETLRARLS